MFYNLNLICYETFIIEINPMVLQRDVTGIQKIIHVSETWKKEAKRPLKLMKHFKNEEKERGATNKF